MVSLPTNTVGLVRKEWVISDSDSGCLWRFAQMVRPPLALRHGLDSMSRFEIYLSPTAASSPSTPGISYPAARIATYNDDFRHRLKRDSNYSLGWSKSGTRQAHQHQRGRAQAQGLLDTWTRNGKTQIRRDDSPSAQALQRTLKPSDLVKETQIDRRQHLRGRNPQRYKEVLDIDLVASRRPYTAQSDLGAWVSSALDNDDRSTISDKLGTVKFKTTLDNSSNDGLPKAPVNPLSDLETLPDKICGQTTLLLAGLAQSQKHLLPLLDRRRKHQKNKKEKKKKENKAPCSPVKFITHRDVLNTLLAGSDCKRYATLNPYRALTYVESYNCRRELSTVNPERELGDCYLSCIPVGQSGRCSESLGQCCPQNDEPHTPLSNITRPRYNGTGWNGLEGRTELYDV
ncbi:uncharacterized protein IWZ02DRAFT_437696 [Phyllosticta citriasiana]|uniref:uncharacterized protein n=1 Tax=Phyllosticta citriasiana TaxID=595635 RepID=UPI0030FDC955